MLRMILSQCMPVSFVLCARRVTHAVSAVVGLYVCSLADPLASGCLVWSCTSTMRKLVYAQRSNLQHAGIRRVLNEVLHSRNHSSTKHVDVLREGLPLFAARCLTLKWCCMTHTNVVCLHESWWCCAERRYTPKHAFNTSYAASGWQQPSILLQHDLCKQQPYDARLGPHVRYI